MLNFFRGALFSCCTFFRVAFFSCCTFLRVSPLYFAPLLFAFFLCNAFFLLRFVCAAIFSFFIHLLLHSLYVTLFSALTLSFDLFHVALFLWCIYLQLHFPHSVHFSSHTPCSTHLILHFSLLHFPHVVLYSKCSLLWQSSMLHSDDIAVFSGCTSFFML